ncbi:MAG: VTT domain-containing protein [Planctomycetota bacterium]
MRFVRKLGRLGPLAAFTALGPLVGATVLAASSETWFPPLEAAGAGAVPCVMFGTVLLAGLSLVPTHASSLVAGLLFGVTGGTLVAVAGVLGAALLGFFVVRRIVGERFLQQLAAHPRASAVHTDLLRRGAARAALFIALIRLSPVMPFAATNLLIAASGVRPWAFLAGSLVGLAPRIVAVVLAGAGLADLDLSQAADQRVVIVGGVATIAALAVIGALSRRALARAHPAPPLSGRP